jgi:hypothetical protein
MYIMLNLVTCRYSSVVAPGKKQHAWLTKNNPYLSIGWLPGDLSLAPHRYTVPALKGY